jgi:molecular chaperone DnaK (HSP70)
MTAIGIDLGTYNSAAAFALKKGKVTMIESRYGKTLYGKNFPSFVLFDHAGRKQVVGQRAKAELSINPRLVVWGVKRLVGLPYRTARERGELRRFQYEIEEGPGGAILIKVGEERYTPSSILELILGEIKQDAEDPKVNPLLGRRIEKAVISIPAYFAATRTAPIVEAAQRAGFQEVDTIAEPTAAAIRYSLDIDREANLLAFDIGAGTLDVTVMLVAREDGELVPGELCTSGHEALGGIDMDDLLIDHVVGRYGLRGIEGDPNAMAILKEETEKAKIKLSMRTSAPLDLPDGRTIELGQGEMEEVLRPLLDRCRAPIRVALRQAGLGAGDLHHVLFVGGPTKLPCVRRVVREELESLGAGERIVSQIRAMESEGLPVDPMECVAWGASLKAGAIIEPVAKVIAEGYGTIYGPVAGSPDYFVPVIRDNSPYPISGKGVLCHPNPKALEIPVPLVAKRPDVEASTGQKTVYRYEYLGNYTLGVTPTGKMAVIEIQLQVTDDKRVVATLTHTQTRQQVRFTGLDFLTGESVELQEDKPPEILNQKDIAMFREAFQFQKGSWTESQLSRHIHVAREALALVREPMHPKVKMAAEEVEAAVAKAVDSSYKHPNIDCPSISNRVKELLDMLRQPGVEQITAEQFQHYLGQLSHIAQME